MSLNQNSQNPQKKQTSTNKIHLILYGQLNKIPTIFLIIFLNLCITIPLAAILNIWIDEAYTLETTGKDIGYAFYQALNFELQPPFYFLLLNIWRFFNNSIFFSRLFSIVCIAVTIYLVEKLTRKWLKRIRPTWLISTIVAFSPFAIWAAIEIRLYALLILLSAIQLLAFYDGYFLTESKPSQRLIYTVASIFAIYTQYYSAFFLVANGVVLLYLRRWKSLHKYVTDMIIVVICFSPMILVLFSQMSKHRATLNQFIPLIDNLRNIIPRLGFYNVPIPWLTHIGTILVYMFLSGSLIAIIIKYHNALRKSHIAIFISTFVIWIMFVIISMRISKGLLEMRHTAILFIPSIFSFFAVLSLIEKKFRKQMITVWIVFSLLLSTISLYNTYKPMAKQGDYARVAAYIEANEKSNQPILVFNAEVKIVLRHHYNGINLLMAIPKDKDFQSYDLNDFIFRNEQDLLTSLARIPSNTNYIWFVKNNICNYLSVDYNCELLEKSLHKYYSVETLKKFLDSEVRLLRRREDANNYFDDYKQ